MRKVRASTNTWSDRSTGAQHPAVPRAGEEGEEVSSSVEGLATSLNPRLSQATGVTSKWRKRVDEVGPQSVFDGLTLRSETLRGPLCTTESLPTESAPGQPSSL